MLAIWVGNAIIGVNSQAPPIGSEEILTELNIQMVSETTLEDLITEQNGSKVFTIHGRLNNI